MKLVTDWTLRLRIHAAEIATRLARRVTPAVTPERSLRNRINARIRRLGRQYEDGNSDLIGFTYHPIYFPGFDSIPSHRHMCDTRLEALATDLGVNQGEWVLDVGANVGYFAFGLAERGALVEAYEAESDTFEIGAALARLYDANVLYINRPMSRTTLPLLRPRYRAVLLLSVFHWIVKQEGEAGALVVLRDLVERSERTYLEVPCNAEDAQFKHPWFASHASVESFLREFLPDCDIVSLQHDAGWMDRVLWRISPRVRERGEW